MKYHSKIAHFAIFMLNNSKIRANPTYYTLTHAIPVRLCKHLCHAEYLTMVNSNGIVPENGSHWYFADWYVSYYIIIVMIMIVIIIESCICTI